MKDLEVKLNLKWFDVLDELKGYIEVKDGFYLIFGGSKFYFSNEKALHRCMRKIRLELDKDKIVSNL